MCVVSADDKTFRLFLLWHHHRCHIFMINYGKEFRQKVFFGWIKKKRQWKKGFRARGSKEHSILNATIYENRLCSINVCAAEWLRHHIALHYVAVGWIIKESYCKDVNHWHLNICPRVYSSRYGVGALWMIVDESKKKGKKKQFFVNKWNEMFHGDKPNSIYSYGTRCQTKGEMTLTLKQMLFAVKWIDTIVGYHKLRMNILSLITDEEKKNKSSNKRTRLLHEKLWHEKKKKTYTQHSRASDVQRYGQ